MNGYLNHRPEYIEIGTARLKILSVEYNSSQMITALRNSDG